MEKRRLSGQEIPSFIPTPVEEMAIFEAHEASSRNQEWFVDKITSRNKGCCPSCKSTMPIDKIYVYTKGLYIPRNQNFAVGAGALFISVQI